MNDSINVIPGDDPKSFRLGWVIYEEVGIAVINNFAVNLINNSTAAETDPQRRLRLLRKMLKRNE